MPQNLKQMLCRLSPGLRELLGYRASDLPHDLAAGLAVAAVALPVGVAYHQRWGSIRAFCHCSPISFLALRGS